MSGTYLHSLFADIAQSQGILVRYALTACCHCPVTSHSCRVHICAPCLLTLPSHKVFFSGMHSQHAATAQSQVILSGTYLRSLLADTGQSQVILVMYIFALLACCHCPVTKYSCQVCTHSMLTLPSHKSFVPGTHSLHADTVQSQIILARYTPCMLTLPSPKSFLPGTHSLYADTAQPQVILAWYIRCLLTRPSHKSFLPGAHSLHADMAQSHVIVLTGPVTNHSCQVHSLLADTAQP